MKIHYKSAQLCETYYLEKNFLHWTTPSISGGLLLLPVVLAPFFHLCTVQYAKYTVQKTRCTHKTVYCLCTIIYHLQIPESSSPQCNNTDQDLTCFIVWTFLPLLNKFFHHTHLWHIIKFNWWKSLTGGSLLNSKNKGPVCRKEKRWPHMCAHPPLLWLICLFPYLP